MNLKSSLKDCLVLTIIFVVFPLALHATGIGCPIKALTGISCPGCGMTRAWLSALRLDFAHALAYHPLYWTVPALLVLSLVCTSAWHRIRTAILVVALVAFLAIWFVRLTLPDVTNMVFLGTLLPEPVVSIEMPKWLAYVLSLMS